jgi:phosphatidylglycerophosphatase A
MLKFIASGFYSGYLPKAPGTWGSLVAIPICVFLASYGLSILYLAMGLCFLGGWYCSHRLTLDPMADPDPSYIVIDEIVGMMLTGALGLSFLKIVFFQEFSKVPRGSFAFWSSVFIAFRIFDICKPFPINAIDDYLAKTQFWRGFGVMIDDVLAAIPAAILVAGIILGKHILHLS